MKKILAVLAALSFLCLFPTQATQAANTTTKLGTIPLVLSGEKYDLNVLLINYDTTGQDLLIEAPVAGTNNSVCAASIMESDSGAQNISFKLDATNYVTLKLAANQGIYDKIGNGASFCTVPGQSLQFKSTGVISSMLIYTLQKNILKFGGR